MRKQLGDNLPVHSRGSLPAGRTAKKRWRRQSAVAGVAALSLLLAACSSSSNGHNAGSSAASSTAAGASSIPTGSPIKIGDVCTCSGAISNGPDPVTVYKAWADSVNAAGGINGHPVQIIEKDDTGDPAKSLSIVQSFISDDHVVAIQDSTNDDQAWQKIVEAAKIPVIGAGTSTTPMYTSSDFFPEGQTEDSLFDGIVAAVKKIGASKLGLLYCAEAVQCQEGIAPLKATAQAAGVSLAYSGSISATAPNYTAQCLAAKQAGVDALFIGDVSPIITKVGTDCSQQGYHPTYVIDGEQLFPRLQTSAGIKDKTIFVVPNLPYSADSPAITEMNNALNKYAPKELSSDEYGELAMESWVSGKLLEAAAKAGGLGASGGTPTATELQTGLAALKGETLGGLAPSLTFAAGAPHPVDCWYWSVLANGKYTTPYGLDPACKAH